MIHSPLIRLLAVFAFLLALPPAGHAQAPPPSGEPTKVTIREDHTLLVNGEPFFPLGLYYTEDERADPTGAALKELRQLGFNSLFVYGAPNKDELDRIAAAGLLAQCGPPGGIYSGQDELPRTVDELKNHPALLLWHMIDEPVLNKVKLEDAKAGYALVKRLDPDHPVSLNHWPNPKYITAEQVKEWAAACDINGFDFYPVPLRRWEKWGQGLPAGWSHSIGIMGRLTAQWKQLVPDKPLLVVLQAWSWDPLEYGEQGYPTPQESRFMAYHCVINGANGINYYGKIRVSQPHTANSLPAKIDPDPAKVEADFAKAKQLNAWFWERHKPVVKELSELSAVFAAPDAPAEWRERMTEALRRERAPLDAVEFRIKQVGEVPVVLMVNNSDREVTLTAPASGAEHAPWYSWLDGRVIQPEATKGFTEKLEPWAVRVFAPSPRELVLANGARAAQ